MAMKQPGPVFTIQPAAPAKPGWWQSHRHQVVGLVALVVGFVIGQNGTDAPAAINTPPASTAPAGSATPSTP
ncbi:hypothetical protein OG426_55620 (plasmid) [Streptomyces canus]|uniref:hypothetical protein n=1 Tax=Streptomyces canus TaxID=58343 RepID=UPI002F90C50F|nr:hypothetical protein OG426_55620 [Streptomyces canus]